MVCLRKLVHASALVCVDGQWQRAQCGECTMRGNAWTCYDTKKEVGLVCVEDGTTSCDDDRQAAVHCRGNRWELVEKCGGTARCEDAECIVRRTQGAPCHRTAAGLRSCSEDGGALLECRQGTMQLAASCKGPEHCRETRSGSECDETISEVDDACTDEQPACSSDGRSLLRCKSNRMVKHEDCAAGCSPTGEFLVFTLSAPHCK